MALMAAVATVMALLVPLSGGPASAASLDPTAGQFVPLSPARLINTANGLGLPSALTSGTTVNFTVLGKGGVPATGVSTVMLHIYTNATDFGYLYAWPTATARPTSSTLAMSADVESDNVAMTQVGTGGQISFQSMATNPVNLIVDVEGYVTDNTDATAGATYVPLTQTRVLATTNGVGGRSTPLTSTEPNGFWNFTILGKGGLPTTGVAAVVMNLAAGDNNTTTGAQLDVGTGGADPSFASWKTFTYPGIVADQLAVVAPDSLGRIALSTNGTSVNVWIDVQGYYLSASAGGGGDVYVPVAPTRIVRTSTGVGIPSTLAAGGTVSVPITGVAGVPTTGVGAVALSMTAENAGDNGYDVMWADGVAKPGTSTIEAQPGIPNSNIAYVRPGADGKMAVYSSVSNDLLVDVEGYFSTPVPPTAPQAPTAANGGGSAYVSWDEPATDGGAAVTSYTVTTTPPTSTSLVDGDYTDVTLTGLNSSVNYSFAVTATNSAGTGPAATATPVTPTSDTESAADGAPDPVTNQSATSLDPDQSDLAGLPTVLGGQPDSIEAPDFVSPDTSGTTVASADAPAAASFAGLPPSATTIVSADLLDSPTDVALPSSSAAGTFAVGGVVTDAITGDALPGATVTLAPASGIGTSGSTTADSVGAFSFVNVPASAVGTQYTTTVTAAGYGQYVSKNETLMPNIAYEKTPELLTTPQTIDESVLPEDHAPLPAAAGTQSDYASATQIPPTIKVAILQNRQSNCHATNTTINYVKTLPWRHYVLRVAAGEIETDDFVNNPDATEQAFKANALVESNFAWWREHFDPRSSNFDIYDASNEDQCLGSSKAIPMKWNSWVSSALEDRVPGPDGGLLETNYASGSKSCNETGLHAANNNNLSQLGSEALDEQCHKTFHEIIAHYYTGHAAKVHAVPGPNGFFDPNATHTGGSLHFESATFNNKSFIISPVAWKYEIEEIKSCGSSHIQRYCPITTVGFESGGADNHGGHVPTKLTEGCGVFRVRAWNPAGWTSWFDFYAGQNVCTAT
jgi:Fibronectin type III domain